ncbi:sigma-70 family RNA polymerase sigma factor [Streptomyces sp. LP05-1]|uniref:Sigma-70 family RNA polymerase sigma factor n=1 Tax=Streptomyces pyxinae TaxID=2970734 RepID=A0ABT2CHL1_9ACTN|nr:sigma-70 family RNA polymerase sigma factor [Streptomyces sp. LP05-1]MCS0636795.1 sigma-70 family RNA polymerase sigma factor [Streptomyces sp. LP05-1]
MTSSARSAPDGARALSPEERFTAVVRARRQPLLRYVLSLLPADPQRAEDVVQETLLRAWLAARPDAEPTRAGGTEGAEAQDPTAAWLFTVARNVVIDWSRRDGVRPAVLLATTPDRPAPADDSARVADRVEVVGLLTPLSRRHREVLVYTYLLGCSGPDAARALAIPPGTVKSRLHHALREARHAAGRLRDCA